MTVKTSSRRAYIEQVKSGRARTQRDQIMLCYLQHDPALLTRNQVEKITSIRINAVTGRVNSLLYPDPEDSTVEGPLKVFDHGPCPVSKSERVELIGVNWPQNVEQMEMEL